jgi:hypothetical protein
MLSERFLVLHEVGPPHTLQRLRRVFPNFTAQEP